MPTNISQISPSAWSHLESNAFHLLFSQEKLSI